MPRRGASGAMGATGEPDAAPAFASPASVSASGGLSSAHPSSTRNPRQQARRPKLTPRSIADPVDPCRPTLVALVHQGLAQGFPALRLGAAAGGLLGEVPLLQAPGLHFRVGQAQEGALGPSLVIGGEQAA